MNRLLLSGLQLFNEAVQGKKIVYLYRVRSEQAKNDATALAFTTENGRTKSKDADTTATKDGTIRTPGTAEVEITATSILAKGDEMVDKLEQALDNDSLLEIWEVNLTELEVTSNAEDNVEVSLTFGINGNGQDGWATVTAKQQEIASYVFTDTQKTGA